MIQPVVLSAGAAVLSGLGAVDILINNAGTVKGRHLVHLSPADIYETFSTNIFAHFWVRVAYRVVSTGQAWC